MNNVLVFGSNGSIGQSVVKKLSQKNEVWTIDREQLDLYYVTSWELSSVLLKGKYDFVVNCAGSSNTHNTLEMIKINSIFPLLLEEECKARGIPLIHLCSNLVFTGEESHPYTEDHPHNSWDSFGKSKSLGVPHNSCTIRTSVVGRTTIDWIKTFEGKELTGFTNHHSNAITCWQLSKIIDEIIENRAFWKGVKHIFSPQDVTNFELFSKINKIYDLNIDLEPVSDFISLDQRLDSKYEIKFKIPSLEEQLIEQKESFNEDLSELN